MQSTNASVIAMNVLTAPNAAFAALQEKPTFLVPLLLLIAAAVAASFLYMNGVDIQWWSEQWLRQNPEMSEAQADRLLRLVENVPQVGIAVVAACFATLGVGAVLLVQALYFKVVTWITRDEVSYQHWFSMVCWCALPSLLTSIASIVNLLTSDVSLMPEETVNPLTFANLTGFEASDDGVRRLLSGYDPMRIWSLALMIVGYRTFAARSLAASAGIVLLPILLLATLTLLT